MLWIPEAIKEFRASLGLTQEKMARVLGLTTSQVSKIEQGVSHPSGPTKKLLTYLKEGGQTVGKPETETGNRSPLPVGKGTKTVKLKSAYKATSASLSLAHPSSKPGWTPGGTAIIYEIIGVPQDEEIVTTIKKFSETVIAPAEPDIFSIHWGRMGPGHIISHKENHYPPL